jgi:hypothetical protein
MLLFADGPSIFSTVRWSGSVFVIFVSMFMVCICRTSKTLDRKVSVIEVILCWIGYVGNVWLIQCASSLPSFKTRDRNESPAVLPMQESDLDP